jgi:hypothetical protein
MEILFPNQRSGYLNVNMDGTIHSCISCAFTPNYCLTNHGLYHHDYQLMSRKQIITWLSHHPWICMIVPSAMDLLSCNKKTSWANAVCLLEAAVMFYLGYQILRWVWAEAKGYFYQPFPFQIATWRKALHSVLLLSVSPNIAHFRTTCCWICLLMSYISSGLEWRIQYYLLESWCPMLKLHGEPSTRSSKEIKYQLCNMICLQVCVINSMVVTQSMGCIFMMLKTNREKEVCCAMLVLSS